MAERGANATDSQIFLNVSSAPGISITAVPEYPAVWKMNQARSPLLSQGENLGGPGGCTQLADRHRLGLYGG